VVEEFAKEFLAVFHVLKSPKNVFMPNFIDQFRRNQTDFRVQDVKMKETAIFQNGFIRLLFVPLVFAFFVHHAKLDFGQIDVDSINLDKRKEKEEEADE
jgi:hypothetical protein